MPVLNTHSTCLSLSVIASLLRWVLRWYLLLSHNKLSFCCRLTKLQRLLPWVNPALVDEGGDEWGLLCKAEWQFDYVSHFFWNIPNIPAVQLVQSPEFMPALAYIPSILVTAYVAILAFPWSCWGSICRGHIRKIFFITMSVFHYFVSWQKDNVNTEVGGDFGLNKKQYFHPLFN